MTPPAWLLPTMEAADPAEGDRDVPDRGHHRVLPEHPRPGFSSSHPSG